MVRIFFLSVSLLLLSGNAFAQAAVATPPAATQSELLTQQLRAEERKLDEEKSNLKYIPWAQAGKSVQSFVTDRDKNAKDLIGSGRHVDIAVYDLDLNGQPDILVYFWDHCGFQGCLFKIFYYNKNKKPEDFFGWDFIPYKKGVMFDHVYFTL